MFLISAYEDEEKKRKEIRYLNVFLRKNNFSITLLSIIHFSANSPGQRQHRCLGSIYYLVISQLRVSVLCSSLWSLNLPLSQSESPIRSDIVSLISFKV